ncbi:MAG: hypothetical protein ACOZNI_23910 [Myxococcota bacterium]
MLVLWLAACQDHELRPIKDEVTLGEPRIAVEPASLSFGPVRTGCVQEAEVLVTNVGEGPLDVTRAFFEGDPGFTVSEVDLSLPPGDSTTLRVLYEGPEGEAVAALAVESDDPVDPLVRVPARGVAMDGALHSDLFYQDPDPIDVLWVIDNSGSMWEEQERIIADVNAYLSRFFAYDLDFHIGVVTTDPDEDGHLRGDPPYVTAEMPDAEEELARAIEVGNGFTGYEQGLYTAELALSEPARSGHNAGFYRDGARLGLVFVSDEPDYSLLDAQHYVDFFTDLKGDPARILAAAVVGDRGEGCESTCDGSDQTALGGDKYLDVVEAFGGSSTSVCDCDLGPFLDAIGLETTDYARRFPLTHLPQLDAQMEVYVDGEATPEGWIYDTFSNAVLFDLPPAAGTWVEVKYLLPVSCDEAAAPG